MISQKEAIGLFIHSMVTYDMDPSENTVNLFFSGATILQGLGVVDKNSLGEEENDEENDENTEETDENSPNTEIPPILKQAGAILALWRMSELKSEEGTVVNELRDACFEGDNESTFAPMSKWVLNYELKSGKKFAELYNKYKISSDDDKNMNLVKELLEPATDVSKDVIKREVLSKFDNLVFESLDKFDDLLFESEYFFESDDALKDLKKKKKADIKAAKKEYKSRAGKAYRHTVVDNLAHFYNPVRIVKNNIKLANKFAELKAEKKNKINQIKTDYNSNKEKIEQNNQPEKNQNNQPEKEVKKDKDGNILKQEEITDPKTGEKKKVITHTGPKGGKFYYPDGKPKTPENKVYVKESLSSWLSERFKS